LQRSTTNKVAEQNSPALLRSGTGVQVSDTTDDEQNYKSWLPKNFNPASLSFYNFCNFQFLTR
jgi:hypothetical protein